MFASRMRTGDNRRFLHAPRAEINTKPSITVSVSKSAIEAASSKKAWFPYNKGSGFARWYRPSVFVVEWKNDGAVIKRNTRQNYPQLGDNLGWKISNEPKYFSPGVSELLIAYHNLLLRPINSVWLSF